MTNLDELIAPYGAEDFLGAVWGQRMEMLPGQPDRFADLLPWQALNDILRRHRLETPRLRLARGGERISPEDYTTEVQLRRGGSYRRVRFDALGEQLRGGATLVIDSIDELYGPIDDLAADLERVLRERVQVNCYASFGVLHGFDTHWDDHDVLAVQVHGRKRWRVFGPTRAYPQRRDVEHPEPPSGDPSRDVILSAGGVLHVPRGWWHDATALDEPSVHLTFGVTGATGADLIAWLADDLRKLDIVRQDLPRFADPEQRRDRLKQLAEAVASELSEPETL
jgi:ribosomal protein L16 Arg81 hydroxylase